MGAKRWKLCHIELKFMFSSKMLKGKKGVRGRESNSLEPSPEISLVAFISACMRVCVWMVFIAYIYTILINKTHFYEGCHDERPTSKHSLKRARFSPSQKEFFIWKFSRTWKICLPEPSCVRLLLKMHFLSLLLVSGR